MPGWDQLYADDFWAKWARRPPQKVIVDWVGQLRDRGLCRVHDMGCGMGRNTLLLARQGFDVVASDISPRAVEATQKLLRSAGLTAQILRADMGSIPFPDGYFDAVLSIGVMEHATRQGVQTAIGEIHRVLHAGGAILASFVPRTRWISRNEPGKDMIEDNTLRCYGQEQLPHHLVDEAELRDLFSAFHVRWIKPQTETYGDCRSTELVICADKPANGLHHA